MGNATIKKNDGVFSIIFSDKHNRVAPMLSSISSYRHTESKESVQRVQFNTNFGIDFADIDPSDEPCLESKEEKKGVPVERKRDDRDDRDDRLSSSVPGVPEVKETKETKESIECVICNEERPILYMVKGYECIHSVCVICSQNINDKCPFCRKKFFSESEQKDRVRDRVGDRGRDTYDNYSLNFMLMKYILHNEKDTTSQYLHRNYHEFKRRPFQITYGYIGTPNARRDTQLFITPTFHIGHLNNAVKHTKKVRETRNMNVNAPIVQLQPYLENVQNHTITCIHGFNAKMELVVVIKELGHGMQSRFNLEVEAFFIKTTERTALIHGSRYEKIPINAPKVVGVLEQ